MSKMKHFRAKEETVKFGQKEFTVEPMKNKELLDFTDYLKEEFGDIGDMELNLENIVNLVREKPVPVINKIVKEEFTQEDFDEAYPNDIYNVAVTFKEVNFTFLRSLSTPLKRIGQLLQNPQNNPLQGNNQTQ